MQGHRVVDVHGSCEYDPHIDLKGRFYDEGVSDGGTCYFEVMYLPESGKYSNVVFHGFG